MNTIPRLFLYLALQIMILASCGKEFLDIKRDKSQVIPHTLEDYQAVLDNVDLFNFNSGNRLSVVGADEYFISDNSYASLIMPYERNGYLWHADVYEGQAVHDWNIGYHRILLANMVLDGLEGVGEGADMDMHDSVRGSALFIRGYNYYQLAQLFCSPYQEASASTDLGIPIRLEADISVKTPRASVKATYERIIDDLARAADLLPVYGGNLYRPSRVAALTMLAKTYLHMGDYARSGEMAAQALALKNQLIDYNVIDVDAALPFTLLPLQEDDNVEVIYFSVMANIPIIQATRFDADIVLLGLYEDGDLRKPAFFYTETDGREVFKGSYAGGGPHAFFSGLAVDELYLIAAECHARLGQLQQAKDWLDTLRAHRFSRMWYEPLPAMATDALLGKIMEERRKELVVRGSCWEDIRRLRYDPLFSRSLIRTVGGETYRLDPDSKRLIWPLPDEEVILNNLPQNER